MLHRKHPLWLHRAGKPAALRLILLLLCASPLLAQELTPEQQQLAEQLELRLQHQERGQALTEYLNAKTRESMAVAQSNHAARPQPIVTMPPAPRTNNPVPDAIDLLNKYHRADLTNPEKKVVVYPDGTSSIQPAKITRSAYTNLLHHPLNYWLATNYTADEIIPDPAPNPDAVPIHKMKRMPAAIRYSTPEVIEQWRRENLPNYNRFRNQQDPKPASGSGGEHDARPSQSQDDLTPEQLELRLHAQQRGREMSESLPVAQSNYAARPKPLVTLPPVPRTNNPVADTIEYFAKHPPATNEQVLVEQNGGAWVMPKKITRRRLDRLRANPVMSYLATNYTQADIEEQQPPPRVRIHPTRTKVMPSHIRTPEQIKQWKHETFPDLYDADGNWTKTTYPLVALPVTNDARIWTSVNTNMATGTNLTQP